MIATRLQKVFPEIIHFNQNAYVKGRTIFDAVRTINEEKKSKEANLSTSTNEAEDEVLTALSMAGDLGKKVDMILNKLQKLDNIEARLDNLHKSIASLEESFAFLEKDVQNLKDKTEKNEDKGRRA